MFPAWIRIDRVILFSQCTVSWSERWGLKRWGSHPALCCRCPRPKELQLCLALTDRARAHLIPRHQMRVTAARAGRCIAVATRIATRSAEGYTGTLPGKTASRSSLIGIKSRAAACHSTTEMKVVVSTNLPSQGSQAVTDFCAGLEGCNLFAWQSEEQIPRQELLERVTGAEFLLVSLRERVDTELLDAAGPQLRSVSTFSVGKPLPSALSGICPADPSGARNPNTTSLPSSSLTYGTALDVYICAVPAQAMTTST